MDRRNDNNRKLAAISKEAAGWFVRLRDDKLSIADQYRYLVWLKQSPAHIAEMLRVCRLYVVMQAAKLQSFESSTASSSNVVGFTPREHGEPRQSLNGFRPWKTVASLSALALTLLLALTAKTYWLDNVIETDLGEWRTLTLVDGSTARLGPRTRLRIDFDDAQRLVSFERGEVVFDVATDASRSFRVDAELAVVQALGTAFGIARRDDRIVITVEEGEVVVTPGDRDHPGESADTAADGEDHPHRIAVVAGEQVFVAHARPVERQRVDVERALAWAHNRLIFETETVAEAIEEFNRRNRIQIEVRDEMLGEQPVRGVFDANDPESFAQVIAATKPVIVARDKPGLLRLEARAPAPRER